MKRSLGWNYWRILRGAFYEWNEDKVPRMAAAIAFYTVFSLTPIIIISVFIGDMVYDRQLALQGLLDQAEYLIGVDGAKAIQLLLENAPHRQPSLIATILGLATMFFAATGAFTELKDSLNTIWEVQPRPGLGLKDMVCGADVCRSLWCW